VNPDETVTIVCECGARFTSSLRDASQRYVDHAAACDGPPACVTPPAILVRS
jgi:hypothetical protein